MAGRPLDVDDDFELTRSVSEIDLFDANEFGERLSAKSCSHTRSGQSDRREVLPNDLEMTAGASRQFEDFQDAAADSRAEASSSDTNDQQLEELQKDLNEVIHKLSGNRSPQDFFVSVLRESFDPKIFRVNVIEKKSGNVLGHTCVTEQRFHAARLDGVFDNFLSVFLLNSIGSYAEFMKEKQ